ncbi:D-alanyl-D-alanine carboxypeptidase/D-alanyl-D-alanine-endopeptidase [Kitasatospora sp. RB6PN24]|uniref:D-alanyl-D-alanine carboxypeptidase/D-alanyl-D-alanine endopeptidase n=1 Tax=Kitasatospora humi TaxID=2893891 RepID=UPI001E5AAFEF|nr:D-alanyl-D-alanine carboxypeptidase/D-alanyl-D-alanine-endopeptidase [Kitasatospora humi]MCC9306631.1 D-alanyl-D-alanine carboxypeptidase/D-alanyl-D-alanine-endopeptidase [Kitasatospora humi]
MAGTYRGRTAALVAAITGFAVLSGGGPAHPAVPAEHGGPPAAAPPPASAAPAVLQPAVQQGTEGEPTTAGVQAALGGLTTDRALAALSFAVVDGGTGKLLLGGNETAPATPASTTKVATSVAALGLLPQTTRLTTKVVRGAAPDEIVLVGAGDPTLTGLNQDQVRIGGSPVDADSAPASMPDLARQTAASLKAAGLTTVHLGYDTSLFTGSPFHPFNDGTDLGPMSALMVDEGRITATDDVDAPGRVADPTAQAVAEFTRLLAAQGVKVADQPKEEQAPVGAAVLGQVQSPTIVRLIERALTNSDNTLAEAIGRQVALASHQPAGYEGAGAATTAELARLGVPIQGVQLFDGSGMNPGNTIPAAVLADLVALAASPDHPQLRPVLTGMPIGGFTGTLRSRYTAAEGTADGAGIVRAKTGSLSGVSTLAGTVVDADGRLLAFALMSKGFDDAGAAHAAMDRIVVKLAACGCH